MAGTFLGGEVVSNLRMNNLPLSSSHYKQLIESISEVERIEAKVNSKKKKGLTIKEKKRSAATIIKAI
jgi:hypothetical protein